MTLEEFNQLDINGRAEWLWQHQPLEERFAGDLVIRLYSFPDFYSELTYDRRLNQITEIKGFRSLGELASNIGFSPN